MLFFRLFFWGVILMLALVLTKAGTQALGEEKEGQWARELVERFVSLEPPPPEPSAGTVAEPAESRTGPLGLERRVAIGLALFVLGGAVVVIAAGYIVTALIRYQRQYLYR